MIETLARDYEKLQETTRSKIPDLTACRLTVTNMDFALGEDGRTKIEKAVQELESSNTGWSRRQSTAFICRTSDLPENAGLPLGGEWSEGGSISHRLVYAGNMWRLTTLSELSEADQKTEDTIPVLRQDHTLIARRAGKHERLKYAVYWAGHVDDPAGLHRVAARFLGFDETGSCA